MQTSSRRGFTLIELLVVIAIIAILAAILFPVFAKARSKARQTACMSNMKQMGLATMQYAQDYDEIYPTCNWSYGTSWDAVQLGWMQHLQAYAKNVDIFKCPEAPVQAMGTIPGGASTIKVPWQQYGGNEYVFGSATPTNPAPAGKGNVPMAAIGRPADLVLIADCLFGTFTDGARIMNANYQSSNGWWTYPLTPNDSLSRHSGGSNLAYGDGHAKFRPQTSMSWDSTLLDVNGNQCPSSPNAGASCWRIALHPNDPRLR